MTVKLAALAPVPLALVTVMGPVAAPAGTVTVICEAEFTVKPGAETPLKATLVAPVKLAPLIITLLPMAPLVELRLLTTGVVVMVKLPAL
jgi:hypothetical protein